MVRQWQELFYDKNYASTKMCNPDFIKIAEAYGFEAYRITTWEDAKEKISKAVKTDKAIFLEFIIESEDKVYPMVAPGRPLNETITRHKK